MVHTPKKARISLLTQMVLLISIVVLISMGIGTALFSFILDDILDRYIGQQAMTVAKLSAMDERIIAAFETDDPSKTIQPIAETIRMETGASYVVIGNKDGIRYSHYDPKQIGLPMGTSNDPVFLENRSVIYRGTGISGPAIKAKTPIVNKQGETIGVSSVGYVMSDVEKKVAEYKERVVALSLVLLVIGIIGAIIIARRVKRLIFGLEPEEISFLFTEKAAILESIRDATVAVDMQGRVVSMNKRARSLLQEDLTVGKSIASPQLSDIIHSVNRNTQEMNYKILLGHEIFITDYSPILSNNEIRGVVFTFRPESEIEQLTEEITKISSFSDNMRAQNHEYLNRLNTIYGLLKLKEYDKATELITDEVKERQDILAFIMSSVKEPFIAACLLGKINRSKELKVLLEIDQDSYLGNVPDSLDTKVLVTILGNLIDNAMEAALEYKGSDAMVHVSFTDLGGDIIFDIEDNGHGVSKELEPRIFESGVTTKSGENRGLGLAIVKNAIEVLEGQISLGKSDLGGARFTVVVPKKWDEVSREEAIHHV
ncbi:sensor histidine kinase [Brevibacillus porteri]|nr:sensor histidine kinase [Brevibacillus porteri]MED1797500.1 sensor histidine kinase [Brevibacillus porteri]MED2130760.1 sensor histidine kinase [Brevibacillus porteri]MED2744979.1 sensor histidine kinase [Brevibacillus porteri]MED2815927.1 sensor histidine kinase [Brevibacillus porteri]MED2895026.1 sensor histidine kinase [Brevibacillus porteri]